MLYSFFLFCLVKNKPIIDSLELNSSVNFDYSQFKLNCYVGSEKIELPILSFADSTLAETKIKIYDFMSREIRKKGKTIDNTLVSMFISSYNRIDLSRLIKDSNGFSLEFVRDCDVTQVLYRSIDIFDRIRDAERFVF